MQLSKKRLRVGLAIRLKENSGERVLNALKFIDDIVGGTEENRVSVVKTRTDESKHGQQVRQFDHPDSA